MSNQAQISDSIEDLAPVEELAAIGVAQSPPRLVPETQLLGSERYGRWGRLAKRGLDLTLGLVLLVGLSPVLLLIGLVVRFTSPGPALFRQTRIGYQEQPFTILKFRTMAMDNDPKSHRDYVQAMLRGDIPVDDAGFVNESSPRRVFKLVDDPRVTSVGRWLRAKSLDELPQLINVLRGEMSLVGPRPCLEYEVTEYQQKHRCRASSVPGMTGLWQVGGRSDLHMTEALDLDVVYVETCSLRGDLGILARTVRVVFRGTGI